MIVEHLEDGSALIDGMAPVEYRDMLKDREALELYVAQKNPRAFVTGLEIGTLMARAPRRVIDFEGGEEGYRSWIRQKEELEFSVRVFKEGEGIVTPWMAADFGIRAGVRQPLQDFEIQGVQS